MAPTHRMPEGSTFYERIVPAVLLLFAILTAGLVVFAIAVILRLIPWA